MGHRGIAISATIAPSGSLSVRSEAVIAHRISAAETNGHRLATQWRGRRAGPLRVDVQVRVSRIAAVTGQTDHVSEFSDVTDLHGDTASLQVSQDNPHRSAFENDVIASHVRAIGLRWGHVSRAIFREHDSPPAWRENRIAIGEVRRGMCRKKP
jgi:hypothetical protein